MVNFIYLIIAIFLITCDKLITVLTIKAVSKKFPDKDKFSIEKNPLASYFFKQFGLVYGSIFYGIFSIFSFFFCVWILDILFSYNISFIIISLVYVFVLINNIKWFVKYSK